MVNDRRASDPPHEDDALDRATSALVASDRRKTRHIFWYILLGIIAFIIVQTTVILGAASFLGRGQQNLAARIDRGLAFTVCIIAVDPDVITDEDYLRCFNYAQALYPDLFPPLPSPVLSPPSLHPFK